eukprot:CCRYP_007338-RA/>CCRYP_007338-RA protein AED:0.33 eAED:0.33 QI:0/-1/0/1/-1/1/1/0/187
MSQDRKGEHYLGLTITWDYLCTTTSSSLYARLLSKSWPPVPPSCSHQTTTTTVYPHTVRTYGAKQQFAESKDNPPLLNKTDKTFVQKIIGVFLYYARAVDCTMLPALGSLATQQSAPTRNTLSKIHHFLDSTISHPDAMTTYQANNMILAIPIDASYLSETEAQYNQAGKNFFLSEDDPSPITTVPS